MNANKRSKKLKNVYRFHSISDCETQKELGDALQELIENPESVESEMKGRFIITDNGYEYVGERGWKQVYKDAINCVVKLCSKNTNLTPPVFCAEKEPFIGLQNIRLWCRKRQEPAQDKPEPETPAKIDDACEHSLPLSWKQWADVFDMSKKALRDIREADNPVYHFRKTRKNARKWTLPKHELPAEYLEKYRKVASQSQPKTS